MHLDDRVRAWLGPGACAHSKDGVGHGHTVLCTKGVEQCHGDAEEAHAEGPAAGPPPHPPQQADPVYRCPGHLGEREERVVAGQTVGPDQHSNSANANIRCASSAWCVKRFT